jgi:hypothetical protein
MVSGNPNPPSAFNNLSPAVRIFGLGHYHDRARGRGRGQRQQGGGVRPTFLSDTLTALH